jgi:hypothetical protein
MYTGIKYPAPLVSEQFTAYPTTLVTTGIQSLIDVGEVDGLPVIRKIAGSKLPVNTLETLAATIPEYRESLTRAGLYLPHNLSVRVCGGLELIDEYISGHDIDSMIKTREPHAQNTWKEMIKQICYANSGTNQSLAMIDTKPANFVAQNGVLYYVDLFPPMLRDSDGLIVPWVPEVFKRDHRMMSYNFGDTRGQITKLLAGAYRTYPEVYEWLETWTLQIIDGNLPPQTYEYILEQVESNFPDMVLFYSGLDISERMDELLE